MPWFLTNTDMLNAMSDLASDPEKLAAFKADPEYYLTQNTDLSEDDVNSILSDDHETMLRALMSKVDEES